MPFFGEPDDPGMDFAIAPVRRAADTPPGGARPAVSPDCEWAVLWIHEERGREVAQRLAGFGHRAHAEAFLADLLACRSAGATVRDAEPRP